MQGAGVPSIKDQLGIWERDQLWVWSHRKFWKKRDAASWFWEILFPFAGAPAKCRRNGQFRHILTAIRVGQTAKVLKIRSSFGPVCGIYNGAQMGNDRQTEPELKRRGPTRVRDRCINASVTCDPRQNKPSLLPMRVSDTDSSSLFMAVSESVSSSSVEDPVIIVSWQALIQYIHLCCAAGGFLWPMLLFLWQSRFHCQGTESHVREVLPSQCTCFSSFVCHQSVVPLTLKKLQYWVKLDAPSGHSCP